MLENLICVVERRVARGPGLAERADNELGSRQPGQQVSRPRRAVRQVPRNGSPEHWTQVTVMGHTGGTLPLSPTHLSSPSRGSRFRKT